MTKEAVRGGATTGRPGGVAYSPHRRAAARSRLRHTAWRGQERAVVAGYRAAQGALARIPLGLTLPAARTAFLAAYRLWPEKRRIVEANAAHMLGRPVDDPAVRALARRMYATYAQTMLELMRLPSRPLEEAAERVVAGGERGGASFAALVDRLRADGRGTIVVSGHIGSIETLVAAFVDRGWPLYGLADDSAYPELYELLSEQRRRLGVEIVSWRNMREIFRVLRRGGILALLVDWGYREEDVPVRLFGSWTTLPAGPAVLAAKTRAVIVPVVNRRLEDGRYAAEHFDPIEVADASDASIARATQAIADALQAMVAPSPEQWHTFKPIWPRTPDERAVLAKRAARMLAGSADPDNDGDGPGNPARTVPAAGGPA